MSAIPAMLDYPAIKPRGVTTEFKTMRFTPLTSFNQYITNDIVRFWIPSAKGFWDPYKSYIEFEVELSATDFPYGHGAQVDNSASSFISEMTIFVDGKEIERRQEYDSIAALLHDAMYTPADKFGKEYEGVGYSAHTSNGINIDSRRTTMSGYADGRMNITNVTGGVADFPACRGLPVYTSGYHPMYPRYIDAAQSTVGVYDIMANAATANTNIKTVNYGTNTGSTIFSSYQLPRPLISLDATQNATLVSVDRVTNPPALAVFPYMADLETYPLKRFGINPLPNYGGGPLQPGINFSDNNILAPRPFVEALYESSCYGLQGTTASNMTLYTNAAYAPVAGGAINPNSTTVQTATYGVSLVRKNGYSQAYSEELSNGSYEPLISPLQPVSWISQGQFLTAPVTSAERVFQIPIISSLLGVLIPYESYKLIPMEALANLMIEFRLNEYAMFTSGYLENFTDSTVERSYQPMGAQLKRAWKINRMEIFGAIFQFEDFITQMISQRLSADGITLSSNGWTIGPRFTISTTSLVENTWQINAGYESVKTVCFRIQSDDYKKYSFCRKHYYYSGNITSLQLEIANVYIPPQPIEGHAGNIVPTSTTSSNAPFIIEMHKTFGKLFNIGRTMYVNATNFAVNDRPYNVANKASYSTLTGGSNFAHTITNIDTAMGLPLFHENRCVGRALYAFNLEALPGEVEVISGLNTLKWRPFEVIIDADTSVSNGRDATLMFFLNYDVIYNLEEGVPPEVYGMG